MLSWIVTIPAVGAVLLLALSLFAARKLADRFASDQFSPVRYGAWWLVTLALMGAAWFLQNPWLFAVVAAVLGFWLLLGTALEIRGGDTRQRIAIVQLFVLLSVLEYAYARSRGVLEGMRVAPVTAFTLDDLLSQLTVPWAAVVVSKSAPAWALPGSVVGAVASAFTDHFVVTAAVATFALVSFCAAYLSERPLPVPGPDLLFVPTIASAVFGVAVVMAYLVPAGTVKTSSALVASLLAPFYLFEALVLASRWLSRLRMRVVLLGFVLALSLRWAWLGAVLIGFGWVGQLLRLRELMPFAALAETPLKRPRLASLLSAALAMAVVLAASSALAYLALRRASPQLGVPAELCGSVKSKVSWKTRTVSFEGGPTTFEMDVDETRIEPLAGGRDDAAATCEKRGKRLCTSDEWYLACLCTYPRDAEAGVKLSGNYFAAARADQERKAAPLAAEASTLTSDKQSEVRSLLSGQSEIVSGGPGGALLVAGPSDVVGDAWAEDCRQRALISPEMSAGTARPMVGVRCCR